MKTLGERIRELREARELSLREFASKVKVTPGFMSDIELGRRHPSDEKLEAMARVLETPMAELKDYDTRPPWQEMRDAAMSDPAYGFAFRRLVDSEVSPRELLEFLQDRDQDELREGHQTR